MKWDWIRRILVVGGVVYVWSLLPISLRPQLAHSPLKKSEQTITVPVEDVHGTLGSVAVSRIKTACKPPLLARMVMAGADNVRVILVLGEQTIGTREVPCRNYVKQAST